MKEPAVCPPRGFRCWGKRAVGRTWCGCTGTFSGDVRFSTMDNHPTTLEKAFHLAGSGKCPNLAYLMKQLKQEGYDTFHIQGPMLKKQLAALIEKTEAKRRSFPLP